MSLIDDDKAPWTEVSHCFYQSHVFKIGLLTVFSDIMVPLHDAPLERVMALDEYRPVFQPRDQKSNTILACSVYALHIRTIFGLISLEDSTT